MSREGDPDFDPLDVRRDQFATAGELWLARRASQPHTMPGTAQALANDVLRDFAALNKVEVQAWDVWGAMCHPDTTLSHEQLSLFDRLAALTLAVDTSFADLRDMYQTDVRVRVPTTIFNSHFLICRHEQLFGSSEAWPG